jgi:glycosyltransferase involved in cell wall biosynthesis
METFATLALPGTYVGPAGPLVGRLVANTELLKALFRYGGFQRYCFFVGEAADREALHQLFVEPGHIAPERLLMPNLLELPGALRAGALSVLHHAAHVDQFFDLIWLRDRYATHTVPVTGQIHSLSYPRLMSSYARGLLHPPGAGDAIFCSSQAGREAVERSFAAAAAALAGWKGAGGAPGDAPAEASGRLTCELPVVPLGVDVAALQGGEREATRDRLRIPRDALVVLALGRFTEYDKMDLFPLLEVFARVRARRPAGQRPLHLLLAGARQGTKTPEMLALWAKAFGVADHLTLSIDFADGDKRHLLAAADLFASPCDNLQETFGISVIEALAAGLPAVVSDFDGYKDSVTPEVGVRVKTRLQSDLSFLTEIAPLLYERPLHLLLGQSVEVDLVELEAALFSLCADDARRAEMSRRARQRARDHYDWSVVIPALEAVWSRLAARPHRSIGNPERVPVPSGDGLLSASRAPSLHTEAPAGGAPHHPLAMSFGEIFAHYPSERIDPARLVRRSELARSLCATHNGYVIYPELKNVFSGDDVMAALAMVGDAAVPLGTLIEAIAPRFPWAPGWRASSTATWLLKHGLLR